MTPQRFLPLLLLTGLTACVEPMACTTSIEPAIVVSAEDHVSGQPITAGLRGVAVRGSHTDSLVAYSFSIEGDTLALAHLGPAGTYQVRLEADGHYPWFRAMVRVGNGDCGVTTRSLVASLIPDTRPAGQDTLRP